VDADPQLAVVCRRGGEGGLPAGSQLLRPAEEPDDPEGEGRKWVRHQGTEQGPGETYIAQRIDLSPSVQRTEDQMQSFRSFTRVIIGWSVGV